MRNRSNLPTNVRKIMTLASSAFKTPRHRRGPGIVPWLGSIVKRFLSSISPQRDKQRFDMDVKYTCKYELVVVLF